MHYSDNINHVKQMGTNIIKGWITYRRISPCPLFLKEPKIEKKISFKITVLLTQMLPLQILHNIRLGIYCKWKIMQYESTLLPRYITVWYNMISDTTQSRLGPQIIFKKIQKGLADIRNSSIFAHIGRQVIENTGFIQIWLYFNQNIHFSWKNQTCQVFRGLTSVKNTCVFRLTLANA